MQELRFKALTFEAGSWVFPGSWFSGRSFSFASEDHRLTCKEKLNIDELAHVKSEGEEPSGCTSEACSSGTVRKGILSGWPWGL